MNYKQISQENWLGSFWNNFNMDGTSLRTFKRRIIIFKREKKYCSLPWGFAQTGNFERYDEFLSVLLVFILNLSLL